MKALNPDELARLKARLLEEEQQRVFTPTGARSAEHLLAKSNRVPPDLDAIKELYRVCRRVQFHERQGIPLVDCLRRIGELHPDPSVRALAKERVKLLRQHELTTSSDFMVGLIGRMDAERGTESRLSFLLNRAPELFEHAKAPIAIPELDSLHSIGIYRWRGDERASAPFSKMIREFKKGEENHVEFLSLMAAEYLKEQADLMSEVDLLVPVPACPDRYLVRNVDLAGFVCETVSRFAAIPHRLEMLQRIEGGGRSRSCSFEELAVQFSLNNRSFSLKGLSILLLDDVVTRGHTMRVCARLLREAGASQVVGFCLARAESTAKEAFYSESQRT